MSTNYDISYEEILNQGSGWEDVMSTPVMSAYLTILMTIVAILLIGAIIGIIANWRIFKKADQPGWAAIIPFYNSYIQYKITWGNGWVFLVELVLAFLCSVPIICYLSIIATLVLHGFNSYKKSLAFGHSIPFAVGLFLFRWIFDLILAFGNSEYLGVPQDGFSFEQLNEKYGRKTNVTFAKPEQPQKPDIRYVKPDNKTDKEQDIVDSDIEYVDVDKE